MASRAPIALFTNSDTFCTWLTHPIHVENEVDFVFVGLLGVGLDDNLLSGVELGVEVFAGLILVVLGLNATHPPLDVPDKLIGVFEEGLVRLEPRRNVAWVHENGQVLQSSVDQTLQLLKLFVQSVNDQQLVFGNFQAEIGVGRDLGEGRGLFLPLKFEDFCYFVFELVEIWLENSGSRRIAPSAGLFFRSGKGRVSFRSRLERPGRDGRSWKAGRRGSGQSGHRTGL